MRSLILYGTEGCHLCEEAERLLKDRMGVMPGRWQLVSVDIASDDALLDAYGVRIPVIKDPASESELGWPFDGEALAAFLAIAAAPAPKMQRTVP